MALGSVGGTSAARGPGDCAAEQPPRTMVTAPIAETSSKRRKPRVPRFIASVPRASSMFQVNAHPWGNRSHGGGSSERSFRPLILRPASRQASRKAYHGTIWIARITAGNMPAVGRDGLGVVSRRLSDIGCRPWPIGRQPWSVRENRRSRWPGQRRGRRGDRDLPDSAARTGRSSPCFIRRTSQGFDDALPFSRTLLELGRRRRQP